MDGQRHGREERERAGRGAVHEMEFRGMHRWHSVWSGSGAEPDHGWLAGGGKPGGGEFVQEAVEAKAPRKRILWVDTHRLSNSALARVDQWVPW